MILQRIIAGIFLLFCVCFVVIVIEETVLGGRRRRNLERRLREASNGRDEGTG